ncbi:hypothetical protein ACWFNE_02715 [Cellulomonas sp. NPDC055163]
MDPVPAEPGLPDPFGGAQDLAGDVEGPDDPARLVAEVLSSSAGSVASSGRVSLRTGQPGADVVSVDPFG